MEEVEAIATQLNGLRPKAIQTFRFGSQSEFTRTLMDLIEEAGVPRYNLSSGGEISPASSTKSRCYWGSSIQNTLCQHRPERHSMNTHNAAPLHGLHCPDGAGFGITGARGVKFFTRTSSCCRYPMGTASR